MNRVDWDSYFDGTMSSDERARIEADPALVRQRDGFAAYRKALQEAAFAEVVPMDRLSRHLGSVAAAKSPLSAPKWVLRAAPVVAGLAVFAWWLNRPEPSFSAPSDRYSLAQSPSDKSLTTSDALEAAEWVAGHSGMEAPVVPMRGGKFVFAAVGKGWASYGFQSSGSSVVLQFATRDRFDQAPKLMIANREFSRGGEGLGWRKRGVSFYVNGCGSRSLQTHASALFDEVATCKWVSKKKRNTSLSRSVEQL